MRFAPRVLLLLASLAFGERAARADVTSWLAIGPGYAAERAVSSGTNDRATTLSWSLGVGSSPRAPFVVGALWRMNNYFGLGTDLGLAVRAATGGFARGDWGVALDAGIVGRWWKLGNYGRYPYQAVLTLGAPWGLGLGVGADVWSMTGEEKARGVFAVLEIDLLRLTVMRQGSTDTWWLNPSPAGGREPATRQ